MPKSTLFTQLTTLDELISEYRTKELQRIAKASDTPSKTLTLLAGHSDWGVLKEVYMNDNTPESVIDAAVKAFMKTRSEKNAIWSDGYLLREAVRHRKSISRKNQEFFSKEENFKEALASNPNTDYDLLMKLADGDIVTVRWIANQLASNKAVGKDILLKLYATNDMTVWSSIASNRKMLADILSEMYAKAPADTDKVFVRKNIAANPASTPELLTLLVQENPGYGYVVASNPSVSPELLKHYQFEGDEQEKRAAVRNRKTTTENLTAMTQTGKPADIAAATNSTKFSPEILKELFEESLKEVNAKGSKIYDILKNSKAYQNARKDVSFPSYFKPHPYTPPVSRLTEKTFDKIFKTRMPSNKNGSDSGYGRN